MNLKGMKLFVGLVGVGWSFFLTFKILGHINATELMWFVFWILIPVSVFMGILHALVEDD